MPGAQDHEQVNKADLNIDPNGQVVIKDLKVLNLLKKSGVQGTNDLQKAAISVGVVVGS